MNFYAFENNISDYDRLMKVIREVHSQEGDDHCWMDIDLIFKAAGLPILDRSVGDKEAMLKNCKCFIDTMCSSGDWKSYQELFEENKKLKQEIQKMIDWDNYLYKMERT